jgi:hypothetical protein
LAKVVAGKIEMGPLITGVSCDELIEIFLLLNRVSVCAGIGSQD